MHPMSGIIVLQGKGKPPRRKGENNMKNEELAKELTRIAEKNIFKIRGRGDLESRNTDWQDFINISVWELKDALQEAYELGRQSKDEE